MRLFLFLSLLGLLTAQKAQAQAGLTLPQYIETYKWIAIEEMHRTGIPASIKVAQGILESGFGNSDLAVEANNHFGIKCHTGWQGPTFHKDDDAKDECFRKYSDPLQSFRDHSEFLQTRERYAFLFKLDPQDYKAWAEGLRKAGYATNPQYPQLLIRVIEENRLFELDKIGPFQLAKEKPEKPGAESKKPSGKGDGSVSASTNSEFGTIPMPGPREILLNNRVKYIIARKGDSIESLSTELGMARWQFIRYNELEMASGSIKEGQVVYLQPKRRKSKTAFHTVQQGETIYSISQKYGVKTKYIYKRNHMQQGEEPAAGQRILLR